MATSPGQRVPCALCSVLPAAENALAPGWCRTCRETWLAGFRAAVGWQGDPGEADIRRDLEEGDEF